MATRKPKTEETPKVETAAEVTAPAVEETKTEVKETPKAEVKEAPKAAESAKEVLRETSHQLGIFTDYIYNVRNKGAGIVVENLGYGDIYISTEGLAKVGTDKERLLFGETAEYKDIERLYMTSASQPVVQILEVK